MRRGKAVLKDKILDSQENVPSRDLFTWVGAAVSALPSRLDPQCALCTSGEALLAELLPVRTHLPFPSKLKHMVAAGMRVAISNSPPTEQGHLLTGSHKEP